MSAIHISRVLESDHLPELKPLLGKRVTISIEEETPEKSSENAPIEFPPTADPDDIYKDAKPGDISKIIGTWPGEIDDGFEAMIRNGRHRRTAEIGDPDTLDEVIMQQDVKPIDDPHELMGVWPGEIDDGFEAAIQEGRHRHSERNLDL